MTLFIAELAGVYYTGGSLNPIRSFAPCVANAVFPSDHWVYWVGPFAGTGGAVVLFWVLRGLGGFEVEKDGKEE
jgi:aquaporin related protein